MFNKRSALIFEINELYNQLTKSQKELFDTIHPRKLVRLKTDELIGARDFCARYIIRNKIGM
jgi:hypothetical protein